MKNQVIIIHDLVTGEVQIGKVEQAPENEAPIIMQDLDSVTQAMIILVREAANMGICPANDSIQAIIGLLQDEFPGVLSVTE